MRQVPWDAIVLQAMGLDNTPSPGPDGSTLPSYIAILTWLKLVRIRPSLVNPALVASPPCLTMPWLPACCRSGCRSLALAG